MVIKQLLFLFILSSNIALGQNTFKEICKDDQTKETLQGASANIERNKPAF